jgi:dTDP-4-amino-4,6-dideoxy-D-galactose acyltransferase
MRELTIQSLQWDSDLFGYQVGKLELNGMPTRDELIDSQNAARKYRLVYVYSAIPLPSEQLVDCRVEFMKSIRPGITDLDPEGFIAYHGSPTDELIELALLSGAYSRFKTDTRFQDGEFEKLYRIWLERSVSGEIADIVYVKMDKGKIAGMITLKSTEKGGMIGLVAVAPDCQGKGHGRALIDRAERYGALNSWEWISVATQQSNQPAMQFYLSCGYLKSRTTYIYHWWNI